MMVLSVENNVILSVIIPVYNVQEYLEECITSIQKQTFLNLEILLINDGSKDQSGAICDRLAKDDSRIRVFHQSNQGVSAARNKGIDNAEGKYITFLDPDDYLTTTEAYEKILKIFTEDKDIDVVHFGFDRESKNRIYIPRIEGAYLKKDFLVNFFPDFVGNRNSDFYKTFIMSPVVTLVLKKNILGNIRFLPIKRTEDKLFFFEVLLNAEKIYVFQELFYFYRMNPGSATQNYNADFLDEMIFSNNYQRELFFQFSISKQVNIEFNNSILYQYYSGIINETHSLNKKESLLKIKRYAKDQNVSKILTWEKCFLLSKKNPLWVLIKLGLYSLLIDIYPFYRNMKSGK